MLFSIGQVFVHKKVGGFTSAGAVMCEASRQAAAVPPRSTSRRPSQPSSALSPPLPFAPPVQYNYRAAIYGWDRSCKRDEEWMRTMGVSPEAAAQPFYHCLPDEADCQRLFGGVRITK